MYRNMKKNMKICIFNIPLQMVIVRIFPERKKYENAFQQISGYKKYEHKIDVFTICAM